MLLQYPEAIWYLVLKIVPFKNWVISPSHIEENLTQKYQYRGLDDQSVYYNENIKNLLQNYRSGYIQLAEYYLKNGDNDKMLNLLSEMDVKVDPNVIPWSSRGMMVINDAFKIAADTTLLDSIASQYTDYRDLQTLGRQLLNIGQVNQSVPVLESAFERNPNDPRSIGLLIRAYEVSGQSEKAIGPLEAWLEKSPGDKSALQKLNEIRQRINN